MFYALAPMSSADAQATLDRVWGASQDGATAPIALYRSSGFAEVDRLELWEGTPEVPMPALDAPAAQLRVSV